LQRLVPEDPGGDSKDGAFRTDMTSEVFPSNPGRSVVRGWMDVI
jgi:hypothetical protein